MKLDARSVPSPPANPKSNDPCWCGSGRKFKRCHRDRGAVPTGIKLVEPGEISAVRSVPPQIARPDYVDNNGEPPARRFTSLVKSPEVIQKMRVAGAIAAAVLTEIGAAVRPGVTTEELDALVHEMHIARGVYPSTLGYHGYQKSMCTSVNEVICHGIPDSRALIEGDIVNLDITIFHDGVHGDCSDTILVGDVDEVSRQLVMVTKECLDLGVAAVRPGVPINAIGRAIETHAHKFGYGVVRAFVGHGIGEVFHMPPNVPHYFDRNAKLILQPGMTFTIEPMITLGTHEHETWDDGWTVVTTDRRRTAQFEHTVLVTPAGVEVLTAR